MKWRGLAIFLLIMSAKFFKPYVGTLYSSGLIDNKKVLILGASHYCTHSPNSKNNSKKFDCPVWEDCTSKKKRDSSIYDLCCPYYIVNGWYDKYPNISLRNSAAIEINNYLENEEEYPTYNNFTRFLIDIYNLPNPQYVWERVAFVNYVQFFLPDQDTPDLTETDIPFFEVFLEYFDELNPDIVIIWGTKITNHFHHTYIKPFVKRLERRENPYFWDMEYKGKQCTIINPYHPCNKRNYWSNNVEPFREALTTIL